MSNENHNNNEKKGKHQKEDELITSARDNGKPDSELQEFTKGQKKIIASIRKNFVTVAPYQALIGGILLAVIWAVLNPLDGMDIGYPLIHIERFPTVRLLATILFMFAGLNLVFAFGLPLLLKFHQKQTLLLGKILSICMVPFLPIGTYFGIYSFSQITDLVSLLEKNQRSPIESEPTAETFEHIRENIKQLMIVSGLAMLHMPIGLLILHLFIITMPIDMAYPAAAASATSIWELSAWILFIVYIIQIVAGSLLTKIASQKIVKTIGWVFALYQILALGIFIMAFAIASIAVMNVDTTVQIIVYFTWIIGVLLNPLGVHFGLGIIKQLKNLKH